ncbi:hypothetical protein [Cryobacterium sp. TMT2-23]|uniref:hypothetical protein n=1 Tax=Cryobacterium sp. TMT2-23 TaxID=1259252 RepID=UPI00106933E2|nr:hypothetical protein [Cryobacterium sp. TMT2-23]
MDARPRPGTRPRRTPGPRLVCVAALAALLLAGCAGGTTAPPAGPGGTAQPSADPGGSVGTVFTDAQLTALLATLADGAGNTVIPYSDAGSVRIAFKDGADLPPRPAAEPAACAAFQPESMLTRPETLKMQFAAGALPASTPFGTDTTMILLKSAPTGELTNANFACTDDQASACSTFTLTQSGTETPQDAHFVKVPAVGDRTFATVVTGGLKPGDVTVSLQALAGTVSIGMGRMVATADADATAADLAELATRIVAVVRDGAPSVPAPPSNAFTPEQLAGLLDGVTGPTGKAIDVAGGSTIRPGDTAVMPSSEACVYDEVAYTGSQAGASTADGDIQGEEKLDGIRVRVTSLPPAAAPPYPFDAKAALFQDCTSVQGTRPGAVTRTWDLLQLEVTTNGEASYAVAYRVGDEWSVLVGARNGSLSVEAETGARSESDLPQAAAGLAAVVDEVLARA